MVHCQCRRRTLAGAALMETYEPFGRMCLEIVLAAGRGLRSMSAGSSLAVDGVDGETAISVSGQGLAAPRLLSMPPSAVGSAQQYSARAAGTRDFTKNLSRTLYI